MAKKKTVGRIAEGMRVRVRDGVASPEFPEILLSGWTGTVCEVSGKASPTSCVLEWDSDTLAKMPADYLSRCEAGGLYHLMACLSEDALDTIEG